MVVLFGKLMTVDDMLLLEFVPVVKAAAVVVVEVVVVTAPDVEESVGDVEDGVQPVSRPRTPVQSVIDEDPVEVVDVPTEVGVEDEGVGSEQSTPLQDDVEAGLVVGELEVTGEVRASWLEGVDDEVGRGQPMPMPSIPSHDDGDNVGVEGAELEVTGTFEVGWLEVVDVEVGSGHPIPMPSSPSHDDDGVVEVTELVTGEPELIGILEVGWLEVGDEEGGEQPIPKPSTP